MRHTPVHTVLLRDGVHAEVTFTTVDGWPVTVEALCDTGASSSSIDSRLADFIGVEYTGTVVNVRNANGKKKRKVCIATFECEAGEFEGRFSVSDRTNLSNPVIIGRDILFYEEEEEEEEEEEW